LTSEVGSTSTTDGCRLTTDTQIQKYRDTPTRLSTITLAHALGVN